MPGETAKKLEPFGLWPSPVSPAMISRRLRLNDVQWSGDGRTLTWLEGRSGRGVLVARTNGEARRELTDEQSVRGGVGYGGGEFTVGNNLVIFAGQDGRLYRRSLQYGSPHPITPPFGAAASPILSPDGQWVIYVFSDGKTDVLGLVDAAGRDWPHQLARGADFYMQPAWHPRGELLAWVEWDHPNMPWDGARLMLGRLSGVPPRLLDQICIAGDDETPVSQPCFSPDGRWLSYIASNGEWDRLVVVDLENGDQRILIEGDQFMLAQPAWVQGMRSHGWNHTSERIYSIRNYAGYSSLWTVELEDGQAAPIKTAPYTWINQLSVSPVDDQLVFLASGPTTPDRVVRWDGRLHVECRSDPESVPIEMLPQPQPITWSTLDGSTVHGLYYPPSNPDYSGMGLPPAILHIHGGPTSQATTEYSAETLYFTTRGYAWLDVNYRGSTGYGRSYQHAQRMRWGETDVEDVVGAAQALADQGLADGQRLVIHGGSAGGYTVLNALVHVPGRFKAGVCLYGVSNLFLLNMETHKFEEHYNHSLIGTLPEAGDRYYTRSPIFHADRIRDPLALFQGSNDRVVPPNQSEEIVKVLQQRGVPHLYRLYEGEGHGFRKSETISDYLQQMERFLQQHVLFGV